MDQIINLIKEKPIFIPRILLNNYKLLNISEEELIVIVVIMGYGNNVLYNPEEFAKEINTSRQNIMKIINNLCNKNILTIDISKKNYKTYEYISLDLLYEKLANIMYLQDLKMNLVGHFHQWNMRKLKNG